MGAHVAKIGDGEYYSSEESLDIEYVPCCFLCRQLFSTYEKLTNHFREKHSHHRSEYVESGKADVEYDEDTDTVDSYQCFVCKQTFSDRRDMPDHFKTQHPDISSQYPRISAGSDCSVKMYSCAICGACFSKKSTRSAHVKTHSKY
jgi:hypothetical protein